jgi:urease accessory protein
MHSTSMSMGTDAIRRHTSTPPPRSGGEGGFASRQRCEPGWGVASAQVSPPAPDPSPPLAALAGGGELSLYRLMAWLSPAYPVGAFSYSGGIEWAVETGDIRNAASLRDWLVALLVHGAGFCDAVLFAHAHRAVAGDDRVRLREIAELAAALTPSKERHLETTAQGAAFVEATRAAWPCPALDELRAAWDGPVAYPVAVAVAAAGHQIACEAALAAYLQALAANWVSAGVRLIPLGQSDGQRVLAALEPVVIDVARGALAASLDDIGSSAFRADIAGIRHETQYTRLFRS